MTKQTDKVFSTKKDFIKFFEAIPEKNWITQAWHDGSKRACALGHIENVLKAAVGDAYMAAYHDTKKTFHKVYHASIDQLMNVNDDLHKKYNSKKLKTNSIKKRVLAYLKK